MIYIFILLFVLIFNNLDAQKSIHDSLKSKLETIFMKDQTFRNIYKHAEDKFGKDSQQMEYFWKTVEHQDSILAIEITQIIDKHGWLGISEVGRLGRLGNTTIWLVIQHGSHENKLKYAPLLKASLIKKESQPNHYARLMDRMLINNRQLQIYGSQTMINKETNKPMVYEIKDPEYVDQRRKEIGLLPIKEYLNKRKIEWTVQQKVK